MNLELFSLCDFAQDAAGKLTIVGTFDTLFVREFPAAHPHMSIAARLRFPVYELGRHKVSLRLRDFGGADLIPPFENAIDASGIGNDSAVSNLTLHLANVRFEKEDTYRISLAIDGEERGSIPLYVRKAPPPHQQ